MGRVDRQGDQGRYAPRGFTLLELLLVISIMGVLTWIGTGTFVKITSHWREVKALVDLQIMIDTAFDRVLANDRVTFWVQSQPINSDRLVTQRISYYIVREGSRHRLVRSTVDPATNLPGQEFSLIDGAQAVRLRFEYASDNGAEGWLDRWDRPSLPRAIRVSLMIEDPNRPDRQLARKAVFGNEVR